jgi:outer membrane protein, multidrug efflux system
VRKYLVFSILSSLLFTGCQTLEQPFRFQKPEPPPREVSRQVPVIREPGGGPVTLYEAMARAVRTNLENEIGKMEKSLDRAETASPAFQTLAELAKSAGYGGPASDPGGGGGFENALHPSGSGMADFKDRSTDVAAIWNVLDFGLLHAVTGDEGRLISKKEGARQKAVRNILQETRVRYYRAAGAEALTSEISRLLHQARETLRATREAHRQGTATSRDALEIQQELIETIRFLNEWARALSNTGIELTEWMGLNPGSDFELVEPAWNRRTCRLWTTPWPSWSIWLWSTGGKPVERTISACSGPGRRCCG